MDTVSSVSLPGSIREASSSDSALNSALRSSSSFFTDSTVSCAWATSWCSAAARPKPRAALDALLTLLLSDLRPVKAPSSVAPRERAVVKPAWRSCAFCLSTACWARRRRSLSVAILGAYFLRSVSSASSRCSRAPCPRRRRKSRSSSSTLEYTFRLGLYSKFNTCEPYSQLEKSRDHPA